MSHNTWIHRTIRPLVRPLAGTHVTPNWLTTVRFVTGLAAAWCFATASPNWAGAWWLISAIMDRADGELARLNGQSSRLGHFYDLGSDTVITALIFLSIGIGASRSGMGVSALIAGSVAAVSVTSIFLAIYLSSDFRSIIRNRDAIADPDDVMLFIAPVAWLGLLEEFIVVAGIGAPLFLMLLLTRSSFHFPRRKSGASGSSAYVPSDSGQSE